MKKYIECNLKREVQKKFIRRKREKRNTIEIDGTNGEIETVLKLVRTFDLKFF